MRKSRGPILANSLTIAGIDAGYGAVRVLEDVSITVNSGETVVLLGTNGNGKSTLMKTVMGIVRPTAGTIVAEVEGERHDLIGRRTEEIVDLGIALVPEGRRLFPRLTVEENLLLGAFRPKARAQIKANLDFCFEAFPPLAERRHQGVQGALPAHRPDGGAEFPPGAAHRRPRLCHRPRQDRVRGQIGGRAQQQRSASGGLS